MIQLKMFHPFHLKFKQLFLFPIIIESWKNTTIYLCRLKIIKQGSIEDSQFKSVYNFMFDPIIIDFFPTILKNSQQIFLFILNQNH